MAALRRDYVASVFSRYEIGKTPGTDSVGYRANFQHPHLTHIVIDLDRRLGNGLQNPKTTAPRTLSFADDLRGRLAANNASGAFDIILPQLDAALTAALAFTGDTKIGPILFDQSRLYPAGSSGDAAVVPAIPPA